MSASLYTEEINKLISEGSKAYSAKIYDEASGKYGKACEAFSKHHEGREDGDLLLLYGKALFQSGVSKSSVLGGVEANTGQVPDATTVEKKQDEQDEEVEGEQEQEQEQDNFQFYDAEPIEGETAEAQAQEGDGWEDVKEGEEQEGQEQEDEEQEEEDASDFEMAWMVLDVARKSFEDKLDTLKKPDIEPPYLSDETTPTDDEYVSTLIKLSETYDILGEVSLEAENFPQSAQDLQQSLKLRLQLYPKTSSFLSESHYKLALALEFCVEEPQSRQKAAEQIQLAIDSTEARKSKVTDEQERKEIDELVSELKEKYEELRKDPEVEITQEQVDIIKSQLGIGGGGQAEKAKVSAAAPVVNDLSNMVRKRKTPKEQSDAGSKKSKKE
ncbi:uncharacterized protein LODBEIA_P25930 [Lodderomyces beijingensis]|uniref:Tetratricopeptide SHNi-TPR domain-containing protein n=1 Tax=Lodderomyces beijingensis TaxID=1775926 RepID=A0ABP0ZJN9_9ASCO